jgi:hypothetical protein
MNFEAWLEQYPAEIGISRIHFIETRCKYAIGRCQILHDLPVHGALKHERKAEARWEKYMQYNGCSASP